MSSYPAPIAVPAAPPAPPASALNPLGGLLWAARISARQFLTGPRKWVILLSGAAFPGLLSIFVFLEKGAMVHPFLQLFDQIYLQGAILFIALLGAIPAFSSDVEDGTVLYLFARPTPRPLIVAGKWLGMLIPLMILAEVPVLVAWPMALAQVKPYTVTTYEPTPPARTGDAARKPGENRPPGGVESAPPGAGQIQKFNEVKKEMPSRRHTALPRDLGTALLATALGVLQYATFFFSIGVVFNRPYILAMVYGVIFEVFVGRTPVNLWVMSKFVRAASLRLMEPVPAFFQGSLETAPPLWGAWIGIVIIPVFVLGVAALIATRKAYIGKGI
ncbi:MAG: ABC transporter permease subunit [Planctomycetota bacterium]